MISFLLGALALFFCQVNLEGMAHSVVPEVLPIQPRLSDLVCFAYHDKLAAQRDPRHSSCWSISGSSILSFNQPIFRYEITMQTGHGYLIEKILMYRKYRERDNFLHQLLKDDWGHYLQKNYDLTTCDVVRYFLNQRRDLLEIWKRSFDFVMSKKAPISTFDLKELSALKKKIHILTECVNARDNFYKTPVDYAIENNYTEIKDLLILRGAILPAVNRAQILNLPVECWFRIMKNLSATDIMSLIRAVKEYRKEIFTAADRHLNSRGSLIKKVEWANIDFGATVTGCAYSRDGRYFMSSCGGNYVRFWERDSRGNLVKLVAQLKHASYGLLHGAFDQDGSHITLVDPKRALFFLGNFRKCVTLISWSPLKGISKPLMRLKDRPVVLVQGSFQPNHSKGVTLSNAPDFFFPSSRWPKKFHYWNKGDLFLPSIIEKPVTNFVYPEGGLLFDKVITGIFLNQSGNRMFVLYKYQKCSHLMIFSYPDFAPIASLEGVGGRIGFHPYKQRVYFYHEGQSARSILQLNQYW